jgi:hypothetical protein
MREVVFGSESRMIREMVTIWRSEFFLSLEVL